MDSLRKVVTDNIGNVPKNNNTYNKNLSYVISTNPVPMDTVDMIDLEYMSATILGIDSGIFDEKNSETKQFGGNQAALSDSAEKWIDDPKIEEIIHKYFPDAKKEDFELLFNKMCNSGCGYIAAINTIMTQYGPDNLEDFKKRFGFDLYEEIRDNGITIKDYNYEYLFLDFFLYYAKNEWKFGKIEDILTHEESLGTHIDNVPIILKKYLEEKGITIEFKHTIEIPKNSEDWKAAKEKLKEIGIEISDDEELYYKEDDKIPAEALEEILKQGKSINVSSVDFNLYYPYDKDGNGKLDDIAHEGVEAHAMTLVGISSDGKAIVSSWGKEFIMNLEEIKDYVVIEYQDFD